jgi:chromosome segregation ATPase
VAAVALLLVAAAAVAGALMSGSPVVLSVAAVAAVVLGVAATRITHTELMVSRREGYGGLARQAQAYAAITEARAEENSRFVATLRERIDHSATALEQIEEALCAAQRRAAEAARTIRSESERADRAEVESVGLARRLEEAEERAAEAIVRVAELQQERDLLLAELDAWRSAPAYRKHA